MTDSSGLLQLGARFYWPEIGRFVQQDPIGDGMNWYAYAGNNPLVGIDPKGLTTDLCVLSAVYLGEEIQNLWDGLQIGLGDRPIVDDKLDHCEASCKLARGGLGRWGALAVGYLFELYQGAWGTQGGLADFTADRIGADCAATGQDCRDCCRDRNAHMLSDYPQIPPW